MDNPTKNLTTRMMQRALAIAREAKTPFGCVIARSEEIITEAPNTTRTSGDPTDHAEMNAIRLLAKRGGNTKGLTLFTTGEPCPMCMSAIMYAGISEVVFAVPWQDIKRYYPQIEISAEELVSKGFREIKIHEGVLHEDCLRLFDDLN
ncbi:MAG: nucleoside deaminase [Clostridia bacterium]|nr:nucleoside deaminase [Clostridia bacterium]